VLLILKRRKKEKKKRSKRTHVAKAKRTCETFTKTKHPEHNFFPFSFLFFFRFLTKVAF